MADGIALELSPEEALVLFDWLARFNAGARDPLFEDQAEERVLWDLEATLESALSAPLSAAYEELLAQARLRVRDQQD